MVGIVCDSACDLPAELYEKYHITVLPCHITLGDKEYLDGINIHPQDIFAYVRTHKTMPKTSAPSQLEIMEAFREKLESFDELVCISMADSISSTRFAMIRAAEELGASDKVHVIDSGNITTGTGITVLEAGEMAAAGATAKEIVAHCLEIIPKVHASFIVSDIMYLYRGGRCSAAKALAAITLKFHPGIELAGGQVRAGKKYRGTIESCVERHVQTFYETCQNADRKRAFVTLSFPRDNEMMLAIKKELEEKKIFEEVYYQTAGSVISCHAGPDCMGIVYRDR